MTERVRRRIVAGVIVAGVVIALNMAALFMGWNHAEVVVPVILLDAGGLALIFWLAWRQSVMVDMVYESSTAAQKREVERVQATLTFTEARYASILESAMDAVISIDASQRVVLFNAAAEQMFGCPRGEAIGGTLDRFLPERFRKAHPRHVEVFGASGTTTRRMGHDTVLTALRSDGTEFPIEASISKAGPPDNLLYTVILRDITRRKAAEDSLRAQQAELRELSAQVLQAREDEKTRIARELHDELGQQLTALKMDLAWARGRAPEGATELTEKLDHMNATLDSTVNATRRISADLRPLMLDDLGLAAAAEWLGEDFQSRSGIACDLTLRNVDGLNALDPAVATGLYRMLQESLTNVARHSQAKHVRVSLGLEGAQAALVVEDDGRGIRAEERAKPRSFGLKGLRERAHYLGGVAEIGAGASGGTKVSVNVPAEGWGGAS